MTKRSSWSKLVLVLWLVVLAVFWFYVQRQDESLVELFQGWLEFLQNGVTLDRCCSLISIPHQAVFTRTHHTFDRRVGVSLRGAVGLPLRARSVASLYGAGLSLVGRYLVGDWASDLPGSEGKVSPRGCALEPFETVLLSRFLLLPGDLVNYAAGALRISFAAFMLATLIGGIPGLLIGVLAGASLEGEFSTDGVQLNVGYLLASSGLLVSSLALSAFLRRRQPR